MAIRKITTRSSRAFSDWFLLGSRDFDYCCDCGLAHENRFRLVIDHKRKKFKLYMKSRRAVERTRKRRKQRGIAAPKSR